MTRHYIEGGITANFNWALIASWYGTFPCAGSGLMLADRPWSGFYNVGKIIWLDAHVTQFTKPGWRYLDSACGYTKGGASFVTLRSPTSADYTILIETVDLAAPETLELTITGGLSAASAQIWSTDLRSENGAKEFSLDGEMKPKNGRYQIRIEPGHVYTISNTTGQKKGDALCHPDTLSCLGGLKASNTPSPDIIFKLATVAPGTSTRKMRRAWIECWCQEQTKGLA
jgi:hypothetical protein